MHQKQLLTITWIDHQKDGYVTFSPDRIQHCFDENNNNLVDLVTWFSDHEKTTPSKTVLCSDFVHPSYFLVMRPASVARPFHCKLRFGKLVSWKTASEFCISKNAYLPLLKTRKELQIFISLVEFSPHYYYHVYVKSPERPENEVIFIGLVRNIKQVQSSAVIEYTQLKLGAFEHFSMT